MNGSTREIYCAEADELTTNHPPPFTTNPPPFLVNSYGSLCKLNGQNFDNSTVLTDTFSFSAAGHVGLSNAINYFTMDFQPTSGDSAKFHNFYPVELTPGFLQHDPSSNIVFHADNVKIPCGLSGKSKLNVSLHVYIS